jgi:hypothetical protein
MLYFWNELLFVFLLERKDVWQQIPLLVFYFHLQKSLICTFFFLAVPGIDLRALHFLGKVLYYLSHVPVLLLLVCFQKGSCTFA